MQLMTNFQILVIFLLLLGLIRASICVCDTDIKDKDTTKSCVMMGEVLYQSEKSYLPAVLPCTAVLSFDRSLTVYLV